MFGTRPHLGIGNLGHVEDTVGQADKRLAFGVYAGPDGVFIRRHDGFLWFVPHKDSGGAGGAPDQSCRPELKHVKAG
jgi:hypothetical protein